jgi:hypothetical protein
MDRSVKSFGMPIRSLIAGGLLAGALGLGYGENGGAYGSPAGNYGDIPADDQTGTGVSDDKGAGGSQGPGTASATAALPPNVAAGWKIRVCSEKTKAQSISFRVGSSEMKGKDKRSMKDEGGTGGSATSGEGGSASASGQTALETATWNQGDPTLITLPESVANLDKIKIEATPAQKDMKSEVCVLYNDHVTKKISFDEKNEVTTKMDDHGTCGC